MAANSRSSWPLAGLALLLLVPQAALAAPPSNDTCAAPAPIAVGLAVSGDTTEAADDYQAASVPSAGPDIVFAVTVPGNTNAIFSAEAPFATALYASPTCGLANTGAVNAGHSLELPNGGDDPLVWHVVVDGIASGDRGAVRATVVTSYGSVRPDNGIVASVLGSGSFGGGIEASIAGLRTAVLAAIADLDARVAALAPDIAAAGNLARRTNTYRHWTFAAGSTRKGYRESLSLFSETAQTVKVSYFTSKGTKTKDVKLVARKPKVIDVNKAAGKGRDVAIQVSAPAAVYAERLLSFRKSALDVSAGEHD